MTLLRALNPPRPIRVETDHDEMAVAVYWRGRRRMVTALVDHWRIDDEWWRETIARAYYLIEMDGDSLLTVFRDRLTDTWYAQPYRAPCEADGTDAGR